jgi:regulator of protease activity HflC (stomatin/prohibitin superfamily)
MFVMDLLGALLVFMGIAAFILAVTSVRVANQYERSVIFRLGKFDRTAGPGLYFI